MKWVAWLDIYPGDRIYGFEGDGKSFIAAGGMTVKSILHGEVKIEYDYGATEIVSTNVKFLIRERK